PGAHWIARGWLEIKIPALFPTKRQEIVLTCPDGQNSVFAAKSLNAAGYTNVAVLQAGVTGWKAARYATEPGLTNCLVKTKDVVLSPSIKGDKEAMKRYLEWEEKLTQ